MHLFELRRDLQLTALTRDGVALVVAYDPLADSYADLEPGQLEVLQLADGKTTVEEIHGALEDAGLDQELEEVRDFLDRAAVQGLMTLSSLRKEVRLLWFERRRARAMASSFARALQGPPADALWRGAAEAAAGHLRRGRLVQGARALEEALALGGPAECRELLNRISALHFQRFGDTRMSKLGTIVEGDPIAVALERRLRPLLSPWILAAAAAAAAIATAVGMVQLDRHELRRSLDPVLVTVVLAISLALHELGHAVACRHVGGRVGKMGVGLLYYLIPIAYADVSGTYLVSSRWKRMAVGAAGVLVNQTLAALAYPVMALTAAGTAVHSVATAVVVTNIGTYVLNLVPVFFRLDGYYLLADLLGTPKLSHDAALALGSLAVPSVSAQRGLKLWVLRIHGAGAVAFRLFFLFAGVGYLYDFLGGWVGKAAAFLLAALVAQGLLRSVATPLHYLREHPEALRTWRVRAALALVVAGVFVVPFPWTVAADGTVQRPRAPARAEAAGQLVALEVRDGDRVEQGQVLGRLENRELEARALEVEARVAAARAALEVLERGERPERVQAARAAAAAAQAKASATAAGAARLEALAAAGLASETELERARASRSADGAELAIREQSLRLVREVDPLAVQQARAALAGADLERAAVERLRRSLTLVSPASGWVATPLEDAEGRWYEAGAAVLEVATADRSEVAVLVPPDVPWTELARAEAWVPSAERELALSPGKLRFRPDGTAMALEAPLPAAAGVLDGAAAKVRFHLGLRPLAFQYAAWAARALRFELWAAELDPG